MPFFDAGKMPDPSYEYVCWLDAMGTKNSMSHSIKTSANFIFKLHSVIVSESTDGISLYPVMDGVYITCSDKNTLEVTLKGIFASLANNFSKKEANNFHKFMVRASIAYGPVIHGRNISNEVTSDFEGHSSYRDSILIGMPMIQSYLNETYAPPFGIYVHESARAFAPVGQHPYSQKWWHWFWGMRDFNVLEFSKNIDKYFDWLEKHRIEIDYDSTKHRNMARKYFQPKK